MGPYCKYLRKDIRGIGRQIVARKKTVVAQVVQGSVHDEDSVVDHGAHQNHEPYPR